MQPRMGGRFIKANMKLHREISSANMTKYHSTKCQITENEVSQSPTPSVTPVSDIGGVQGTRDQTDQSDDVPVHTEIPGWKEGRRIVELGTLAAQMRNCIDCGQPLHLNQIVTEKRIGFSSMLYIHCTCGVLNSVSTNKSHRPNPGSRGMPVFDVNTKAAVGMLHTGIGHTQMTNFMSTLEIRGLHHSSLKSRENEVSRHVRAVAKDSCTMALEEEVTNLKESESSSGDVPGNVQGQFKYDMGWQKRGSGRAYDSKSGVGTMIGNTTGKICAYGVRKKGCRKCQFHTNKGHKPPPHECHNNWDGSSKAMESDVGGKLVKDIEAQGVDVSVLIMDDDATTMARIRQDITHSITKWSDINHTTKHLGNSLYSLQKKHKALSTTVIKWIQKCFNYAIAQNKENATGCREALSQIVPHAFGNHDGCDKTWCGYLQNPETYKHKSLPYGRDLTGDQLRKDLEAIMKVFVANAERLAPGGSTKDVESFNNMVAAKAPKRCHYSASGSLDNRVDCAVAQKNMGLQYVNKINTSLGLSPGNVFKEHAIRKDTCRKRRLEYEGSTDFKRRRLQLKFAQKNVNRTKELREGVTYKSAVATVQCADITEIPPPHVPPVLEQIPKDREYVKVFCDTETTSLAKDADIIQISAICGEDSFDQYIAPNKSIAPGASAVTGLSSQGSVLFYHGTPVDTLPLKAALQSFLAWLDVRAPSILIGHNFKSFDLPRLLRAFDLVHLSAAFSQCVVGIVDTLPLFRELNPGLPTYKQEALVSVYLNESYEAHNSLADVQSLQKLYTKVNIHDDTMFQHSATITWGLAKLKHEQTCAQNIESFRPVLEQKIVSKAIVQKLGSTGLCLGHLKLAHSRGGLEGLTHLLTEKVNGKVRVTATKRIIASLDDFISS